MDEAVETLLVVAIVGLIHPITKAPNPFEEQIRQKIAYCLSNALWDQEPPPPPMKDKLTDTWEKHAKPHFEKLREFLFIFIRMMFYAPLVAVGMNIGQLYMFVTAIFASSKARMASPSAEFGFIPAARTTISTLT